MGWYINGIGASYSEKVTNLKNVYHGEVVIEPKVWCENLVCIVDNGPFAAAAWIKDQQEFNRFIQNDGRRKSWMIVPNASELAK